MEKKPAAEHKRDARHRLNIGLIVFIAIFIYMAVNSVIYLTRGHVSFFEVEHGEIIDEDKFTGFILRNEQVVKTSDSGYISFYVSDGKKAAKNENVCLINKSDTDNSSNNSEDKKYDLNDSDYSSIRDELINFNKVYSDSNYSETDNLRYDISNIVNQIVSRNNIDTIDSSSSSYKRIPATDNGVISYTIDGMEGYTQNDINPELFTGSDYTKQQVEAGSYIKAKDPAFKIINDDSWNIIIKPNDDQISRIQKLIDNTGDETPSVDVNLIKDNLTVSANIELFSNGDDTYASLEMNNYMSRFCNDRYIEVQLVWNSFSGMKIPSSSLTKRDYYMVPSEYIVTEEGSDQNGFYIQGDTGTEFIKPGIALQNDDYCYIDCDNISSGTILINNNTGRTYSVSTTSALDGVYNINQGYTKFCLVNVLYQYGDYSIVENASDSGISLYDHVILDGSSVHNNEIVY